MAADIVTRHGMAADMQVTRHVMAADMQVTRRMITAAGHTSVLTRSRMVMDKQVAIVSLRKRRRTIT